MKLTSSEQATYKQCLGKCHTCLLEGGCALEDKLKKSATEKGKLDAEAVRIMTMKESAPPECTCLPAKEAYWEVSAAGDIAKTDEAWHNRGKAIYNCPVHGKKAPVKEVPCDTCRYSPCDCDGHDPDYPQCYVPKEG